MKVPILFDDIVITSIEESVKKFSKNLCFYSFIKSEYQPFISLNLHQKDKLKKQFWLDTLLAVAGDLHRGDVKQLNSYLFNVIKVSQEEFGSANGITQMLEKMLSEKHLLDNLFNNLNKVWKKDLMAKSTYKIHSVEKLLIKDKIENSFIRIVRSNAQREVKEVQIFEPVYADQKICIFSRDREDIFYGLPAYDFAKKFPACL